MKLTDRLVMQTGAGSEHVTLGGPRDYPGLPGVRKLLLHTSPSIPVNFTIVEFDGGSDVPAHESPSVNFWLVLDGEITSLVPNQEPVVLREGDVCVQTDVEHGWRVADGSCATVLGVVAPLSAPAIRADDEWGGADHVPA